MVWLCHAPVLTLLSTLLTQSKVIVNGTAHRNHSQKARLGKKQTNWCPQTVVRFFPLPWIVVITE